MFLTFPFTSGSQSKSRPALVILDTGDADVVVAKMTTYTAQGAFDVPLIDWAKAGLNAATTVRLHKVITAEKTLVRRVIGSLEASDRSAVGKSLRAMLANW